MSPATIALILQLVEAAIAEEPAIAIDLQNLFSGSVPTPAQWAALRAVVASESYGTFVPSSSLPPSETGAS
jgi:hypothetical protein